MAATDLYDALDQLLGVASQACATAPGGPMQRVFVSPGPPAWDCPNQLTVHAGGPVVADTAPLAPPLQPGHRIEGHRMLNLVTATITALRCAPVLEDDGQTLMLPTEQALEDAAKQTLGDCWAIWNHLATLKRNLTLWPPKERELFFDPAVAVSIQGGLAGWQLQVRFQLDGYRTVP